jgi:ectoine hydroxylase-related dioxygenase (phytanoyl-CoA dioxygenase family)
MASTSVRVTAEEVARYQRDGAVLIKGVLTPEELGLLERGLEEAYAEPGERFTQVKSPEGAGETLLEMFPSLHCPSLQKLLETGHVAELAGRLMEAPSAQLILDQTFYKTRGHINPTPWHQDTPFLRVRGQDMARVWLSCDPSPRDLTIQVVRGSQRWNVVYNVMGSRTNEVVTTDEGRSFTFAGMGNDALPPAPDVASHRDSFEILEWDVEPGDALVFNGNVLHGADGRRDHPRPRRAFTSMWGGPELRYHHIDGNASPTLAEIHGHVVPHGARVGDYEHVFRVGWKSELEAA